MKVDNPKTFSDIFKRNFKVLSSGIHTSLPGVIEVYTGGRICSVKPQIQKKLVGGTFLELPIIEEVPIIFPGGTEFGMSWPLKKGDPVLIFFCERSIEEWISDGNESKPEDLRRFSLTDAVAIPGLFNKGVVLPVSNNEDVQIIYKTATIILKKDGTIEVNGNTKGFVTHAELNTALQTFITALNLHVHPDPVSGTSGPPVTPMSLDISASETLNVKTGV